MSDPSLEASIELVSIRTDVSSIVFEFSTLGRPMLCYAYDQPVIAR